MPAGFGEGEVVSLILERILFPCVDDDIKGLVEELGVELGVAPVSSGAELSGGPGVEATSDAEVDTAVGEVIQQGYVLGDAQGMPVGENGSALADSEVVAVLDQAGA